MGIRVLKKYNQLNNDLSLIYDNINDFDTKELSLKDKAYINYIADHLSYIKILSLAIGKNIEDESDDNEEYITSEIMGAIECIRVFHESLKKRELYS